MEEFLETLGIVLPALGITMFQSKSRPEPDREDELATGDSEIFEMTSPRHGLKAQAEVRGGEFIVKKGSTARGSWVSKAELDHSYRKLHESLAASGILEVSGEIGVFTENFAFNSPSAAAAVVNGRPSNGRTDWKHVSTGQTLKDWEIADIARQYTGG